LLECEGALKELPAVQAATQDKMTFQQSAGGSKSLENFFLCHRANFSGEPEYFKAKSQVKLGSAGWKKFCSV
jgi:hypothetical protein